MGRNVACATDSCTNVATYIDGGFLHPPSQSRAATITYAGVMTATDFVSNAQSCAIINL